MLDRVVISNFKCLRQLNVQLRPLTVLIGQNDTGKSTFLRAIQRLAYPNQGFDLSDVWRCLDSEHLLVRADSKGQSYGKSRLPGGAQQASYPMAIETGIGLIRGFHLPSEGVAMQCNGYAESDRQLDLGAAGERVPALLDFLLRKDRRRFDSIEAALRTLIRGFENLAIETPTSIERRVDLVIENGLNIPANSASVGLRMMLFFVALAYHPAPPKVILLEEPENGVHPRRLGDIIHLLREITEGKHGNSAAQVVLSTHSPYLLDCIDAEQDQVLVFQRNEDGSRSAEPADAERLRTFLDEFMLGEVWFNQGEEGLVSVK